MFITVCRFLFDISCRASCTWEIFAHTHPAVSSLHFNPPSHRAAAGSRPTAQRHAEVWMRRVRLQVHQTGKTQRGETRTGPFPHLLWISVVPVLCLWAREWPVNLLKGSRLAMCQRCIGAGFNQRLPSLNLCPSLTVPSFPLYTFPNLSPSLSDPIILSISLALPLYVPIPLSVLLFYKQGLRRCMKTLDIMISHPNKNGESNMVPRGKYFNS